MTTKAEMPASGSAPNYSMFRDVWTWAGKQRTVYTNIGVDFPMIGVELRILFDDARYWFDHGTYPPIEYAVRMHHRLAFIHPFPNGNGRPARQVGTNR